MIQPIKHISMSENVLNANNFDFRPFADCSNEEVKIESFAFDRIMGICLKYFLNGGKIPNTILFCKFEFLITICKQCFFLNTNTFHSLERIVQQMTTIAGDKALCMSRHIYWYRD